MPGRKGYERALGPYPHGSGFRIVAIGANGDRINHAFASEGEAAAFKAEFNRRATNRTVEAAMTEYLAWYAGNGLGEGVPVRASSLETAEFRLRGILEGVLASPIAEVLERDARRIYEVRRGKVKVDTHCGELSLAKRLWAFAVERGWVRRNVWEGITTVGRRTTGKKQLRVDSARAWLSVALADPSPKSTAAAMALLMGMRNGEIVQRLVRDVDDDGRLLWITDAKTAAGERELPIPEVLRGRIAELVAGKERSAPLFPGLTRHQLHTHVERLCRLAGVDVVCPHGLRGTFATLSARSGVNTETVARSLGHAGTAVTRRHYMERGADQYAAVADFAGTMDQNSFPSGEHSEIVWFMYVLIQLNQMRLRGRWR